MVYLQEKIKMYSYTIIQLYSYDIPKNIYKQNIHVDLLNSINMEKNYDKT